MPNRFKTCLATLLLLSLACAAAPAIAQTQEIPETTIPVTPPTDTTLINDVEDETEERVPSEILDQYRSELTKRKRLEKDLARKLSGIKLIGNFTVTGQNDKPLTPEEYHIMKAIKLDEEDYWALDVRIKYGKNDRIIKIAPIAIKFAGETPVITVDRLFIPGMGTFDSRVILRQKKYAGTWSHDNVGGHLFGQIEKLTAEELKQKPKKKSLKEKTTEVEKDSEAEAKKEDKK